MAAFVNPVSSNQIPMQQSRSAPESLGCVVGVVLVSARVLFTSAKMDLPCGSTAVYFLEVFTSTLSTPSCSTTVPCLLLPQCPQGASATTTTTPNQRKKQELALCHTLDSITHACVPADTHSTREHASVERLWVAPHQQ